MSHRTEPSLLVAGLLVHVYAVLMIVLGARVIVSIRMLDLDAPVVEIQRALARLRRSYVMTGFVVGVPWRLLWIPLAMVVFGFDLGRVSRAWLVANVIVGVVGIAGTLWYYRSTHNAFSTRSHASKGSDCSNRERSVTLAADAIRRCRPLGGCVTSFRIAVAGAALVVLVGAVLEAQQAEPRRIAAAPAFNARALTSNPTKDWITNGGNVFNQRGAVEKTC